MKTKEILTEWKRLDALKRQHKEEQSRLATQIGFEKYEDFRTLVYDKFGRMPQDGDVIDTPDGSYIVNYILNRPGGRKNPRIVAHGLTNSGWKQVSLTEKQLKKATLDPNPASRIVYALTQNDVDPEGRGTNQRTLLFTSWERAIDYLRRLGTQSRRDLIGRKRMGSEQELPQYQRVRAKDFADKIRNASLEQPFMWLELPQHHFKLIRTLKNDNGEPVAYTLRR